MAIVIHQICRQHLRQLPKECPTTQIPLSPTHHVFSSIHRYPGGRNGPAMGLQRWRGPKREPGPIGEEPKENGVEENGLSDPAVTPEEPLSEPLPERPQQWSVTENGLRKSPALTLHRQQSLVILTGGRRGQIHTHTEWYTHIHVKGHIHTRIHTIRQEYHTHTHSAC